MAMSEVAPTGSLESALAHAGRLLGSDPRLAAEQAREILDVVHGHPPALLVLAASHNALGRHQAALEIVAPLAAAQPRWAMAHLEHGRALAGVGRAIDGVAAMRHALALKPDLPGGWLALADQLMALDESDAAAQAYANHVRHSTRDPGLLAAATALCDDRIPEAEALLRAHLKRAPTDVAAIRMLAEVAARLGRDEDAEELLARCLRAGAGLPRGAAQLRPRAATAATATPRRSQQADVLLAAEPANPELSQPQGGGRSAASATTTQAIALYEAIARRASRSIRSSG